MHAMEEIVLFGFCRVTEGLTSIRMLPAEKTNLSREDICSGIIQIHGSLNGRMLFILPFKMVECIIFRMNHEKELQEDEKEGYFREYLNIVAGCTVSGIANFLGQRMRFSIPIVKGGICEEFRENKFHYRSQHNFSSELGSIRFVFECDDIILDNIN